MNRCANCGSGNHQSFDCTKPYNGWREREPAVQKPVVVELADPEQESEANHSGLSGRLPRRALFPFLRESTKCEIEKRIGEQKARLEYFNRTGQIPSDMANVKSAPIDRGAPLNLPKADKKPKQAALKVEGGLFW